MDRTTWLLATAQVIETAVRRRDTGHAVFHGCYDWHSAVHGHWALLRIARVTGEARLAELVDARLTPQALATELALLREQPAFELPYGRAWLLRLAIEHAEVTDHTHMLRAIADEAAGSLVALYAARPPAPASREYANAAWALAQLAAYARSIRDKLLATTVQRHVEAHFLDAGDIPGFDDDRDNPDFFSVRGNWLYLLSHAQRGALDKALADAALDERVLAPVDPIQPAAHHFGSTGAARGRCTGSPCSIPTSRCIAAPTTRTSRSAFAITIAVSATTTPTITGSRSSRSTR